MLSTPQGQKQPFIFEGQTFFLRGINDDVDTATVPETIWPPGGLITFPAAAATIDIVSASANDAAAGTGAQTLFLQGVDGNFDEITEVIALDGLTPVTTVREFLFINFVRNITTGSLNVNQGDITFTSGADFIQFIPALKGQAQTGAMILPNARVDGTVATVTNVMVAMGRQPSALATIEFVIRFPDGTQLVSLGFPITSEGGRFELPYSAKSQFPAGTAIDGQAAFVSSNNVLISFAAQLIWIPA
jgi:hypothetical protein